MLFLALVIKLTARNHFCRGIFVLLIIVPDNTLKLLWRLWQFQRLALYFRAFAKRVDRTPTPAIFSRRSRQNCSVGKRLKIASKFASFLRLCYFRTFEDIPDIDKFFMSGFLNGLLACAGAPRS